jgi:UDPglucose 6-dehydrogenase
MKTFMPAQTSDASGEGNTSARRDVIVSERMRVVVYGAGYVGLVTGTCLAECGHRVLIVDIDEERIAELRSGKVPFHEPGLPALIGRNIQSGRLEFDTRGTNAAFYFIAVGTPARVDGSANTDAVFAVADAIGELAPEGAIVVVKSTVPVGTCAKIAQHLADRRLNVVSNPEFLKEGDAVRDFFHPDRIVIGRGSATVVGEEAAWPESRLRALYEPLQLPNDKFLVTDWASAELCKYASNTLLATRISFMNELSRLCSRVGANINDVRLGVGSDTRIGRSFLFAGPGYGGSCFPKDVQALAHLGIDLGVRMLIAEAAHEANENQRLFIADLVQRAIHPGSGGKKVAFWGLAFKPETDDVRESISVYLVDTLPADIEIVGCDPAAEETFKAARPHRELRTADQWGAVENADALVLLTEWRCFRTVDFREVARRMKAGGAVIDARNIWEPRDVRAAGLRYFGVGIP